MVDLKQGTDSPRIEIGLAPMEGVTDFATRLWVTQNGAPDFTTTPFLRVTKDYPPKRISANFLPETKLSKAHGIVPCIPQLMASCEDDLIRIAEHFLKDVPFVDINCGCPSPTVVGHGAGSSLLQDPQRFYNYLRKIVDTLGARRVSVKMRIGFWHESEFPQLIAALRSLPLARLTIHGRTRADRYKGLARWSPMADAAGQLKFPVFGSGDVTDVQSFAERIAQIPALSGVIVGRGALRDPWIFARLRGVRTEVSRKLLRCALLQFVLLQEMQSNHWETFIAAVQDGVFALPDESERLLPAEFRARQSIELVRRAPALSPDGPNSEERLWLIGRGSVARAKMLWNYLRSGVALKPELSVALLRAPHWLAFVDALDNIIAELAESDVGIAHRKEWDWVYSGEGAGGSAAQPQELGDE